MKTRLARQFDVLALRHLVTEGAVIIAPSQLEDGRGVLVSTLLPGGERSWVAEDDSGIAGFVQARPRKYVLGWEVTRAHVRGDTDAEAVVAVLVQEILQFLQDRGIPRLFARVPVESPGHNVLVACGFTQLLSETIFVRTPEQARPPDETPVGMRYRMPQDAWPLRQLENSQTPLLISQLEGLTSSNWSMPAHRILRKEEPNELVVERDGDIVGWVGWSYAGSSQAGRDHVRLGLMTGTDHTDLAAPLLDYALYVIGSKRPGASVTLRLRDYQTPLMQTLFDRDFREVGHDTLFIKHGRLQTVAKRIGKLFELAPTVHAFSLEPVRKPAH